MEINNPSEEVNENGFYKDFNNYRHFALILENGEIGHIQQINIKSLDAMEIWELEPYVVEVPEGMKGKVKGGWYYQDGAFVTASERRID